MRKKSTTDKLHTMQTKPILKSVQGVLEILRKHPSRTYTLTDLATEGLIPWARDARTIRKALDADIELMNLLSATVTGDARTRRYQIPARGLIRYLQAYGPALMTTARRPKQSNPKRYGGKTHTTVQKRA